MFGGFKKVDLMVRGGFLSVFCGCEGGIERTGSEMGLVCGCEERRGLRMW